MLSLQQLRACRSYQFILFDIRQKANAGQLPKKRARLRTKLVIDLKKGTLSITERRTSVAR